jgi:hypothetical protein
MPAVSPTLDDLLPLLRTARAELHRHVSILEVSNPALLLELAVNPRVRRFLLGRLSDTAALIDPDWAGALIEALRKEGHLPKISKEGGHE